MRPGPTPAMKSTWSAITAPPPSVAKARRARSESTANSTFDTDAVAAQADRRSRVPPSRHPDGSETGPELDNFAAQPVAVSEWARGLAISSGPNLNTVSTTTSTTSRSPASRRGPRPARPSRAFPLLTRRRAADPRSHRSIAAYDVGNFAIDCTGSSAERRPRSLRGPIGGSDRWSECLRSGRGAGPVHLRKPHQPEPQRVSREPRGRPRLGSRHGPDLVRRDRALR